MKTSLAIFLMICLQVAISPLCLCYGADVSEDSALRTCCHAPEGTEPDPCPHCDQEQPMAATPPTKGAFKAEAPEWSGMLVLGVNGESDDLPSLRAPAELVGAAVSDPRRSETRALFQVFLI